MEPPILLDAYAARSCPVKTHNAFDRTVAALASLPERAVPDEALAELFEGGQDFEASVVTQLAVRFGGSLVDLRDHARGPAAANACLAAMAEGVAVIVGGLLPLDRTGHRRGAPDLLIRAADGSGYHPVEIKFHKVLERRRGSRLTSAGSPGIPLSELTQPSPEAAEGSPGLQFRLSGRAADLVQLAHYQRMLRACGHAATSQLVGVIGTDTLFAAPVIAWINLDEPMLRTFSRTDPSGRATRSVGQRYDHEHAFRVEVAQRARERRGAVDDPAPLVRPIRVDECTRCPWWSECGPQLHPDDVSVRINKGALDPREIATLRARGIETITDLAAVDLAAFLAGYLPEVTHRPGAEDRLRLAARRARMLLAGASLDRTTSGAIPVPSAAVEIDFDLETSPDGRAYLWGFLVNARGEDPRYVAFSRFERLDDAAEAELAAQALGWLRAQVARAGGDVRVYHYSEFELTKLDAIAGTGSTPLLRWAQAWCADQACDLLEVVKAHFFGAFGLGLKVVATDGAGFAWRDDDPGGLNSQAWFTEAVVGQTTEVRQSARQRVLDYNEDDVTATARVRAWLRSPQWQQPEPVGAGGRPLPR
ncbi:MAG: TM0106 family RecB-like putative nuclease [Propionibacteriaceae bacterium]